MASAVRKGAKALLWATGGVFALLLLYAIAAMAGSLIPRNSGWQEPDEGIQIWVRTNGVHADVVLPANEGGVDWYALLPPEHVRDPERAQGWIGIGWGQREFYLETERWADLGARTAVRALTGGDPLMHIGHLSPPEPGRWHRPLRLSPEAYRRMSETIMASFERDQEGDFIPLIGEGYSDHDTFYEARGTYHAFRTSNQWTSDILAVAGVTIGVWTPFEQGIMWRFRAEPDEQDRLPER